MIYDYLITNKFSASYKLDVMTAILNLLKRSEGTEITKKNFTSKIISFEQAYLSILDLPKDEMRKVCRSVLLRFKEEIHNSLPSELRSCSVFLINSDQWGFLIIKKEENGDLIGVYNQPDGQNLSLFNHCPTIPKYYINLSVSKIFEQLGINVRNINLKTNCVSKTDSGAVTIAHLFSALFCSKGFLYQVFSPEDIVNLRIIHGFVPHIIEKMLHQNQLQDAQNLFENFIHCQIRGHLIGDFLQDIHNKLSSFGLIKNEIDVFKEATSHIDMTKDKDFCDKIDQLLNTMQSQIKQNIKQYQRQQILLSTKLDVKKLNLIKTQSQEHSSKELKKQIQTIFPKGCDLSELFASIWYHNNLRFKVCIEELIKSAQAKFKNYGSKIDFIDNLQHLIHSERAKDKKESVSTIFESEEMRDPDFGPWNYKDDFEDVDLSGLSLADVQLKSI